MTSDLVPDAAAFPFGNSAAARLLRAHDWTATSLGPIATWSPGLRAITAMMIASPIAMSVMWGADGIMLYNDAYAVLSGGRHPALLGKPVREGWLEIADFSDHVMRTVLAGESLSYRDREMKLFRNGDPETLWVNLDYSPLLDDAGVPVGVLTIVTETTQRVLADRQIASQRDRLRAMFEQAPGFVAMMEGPEHVFAHVNQAYRRLMASRDVVGKRVRDAVPEAISHGLLQALDTAYASGKPFAASDFKFAVTSQNGIENHYLDFIYQPIRDPDGIVCGIFAQGSDVTERVMAEDALRKSRQEYRKLNDALIMANDILAAAARPEPDPAPDRG